MGCKYETAMQRNVSPAGYLNPSLLKVVQKIRSMVGEPITINDWHKGGGFINSGVRDLRHPFNSSFSRHYMGLCADLKFPMASQTVHAQLFGENNTLDYIKCFTHETPEMKVLKKCGLTAVENIELTTGWIHVSVEFTGMDKIKVIG